MKTECSVCKKEIKRKPSQLRLNKYSVCGRSCRNAMLVTGVVKNCENCGIPVFRRKSESETSTFCNRSCATSTNNRKHKSGENHPNWLHGNATYRVRALRHYGRNCMNKNCRMKKAGVFVPERLLDVDHINGDRENNVLKNLQVLCVWCHALKTRILGTW